MKNEEMKTNVENKIVSESVKSAAVDAAMADELFAISQEEMTEAPLDDEVVSNAEWKFPGLLVFREPFKYNGRTCYSYKTKMNMLWNGKKTPLEAEMNSADRKNPDSYGKLDMLFDALPEDKRVLKLGFQYADYSKTYSYCVQLEDDNGIPMRVTLQPRNATARDNLATMIAVLKQKNLL